MIAPLGLGLILLGCANQLALALGWIALGNEPGEGPGLLESSGAAAGWIATLAVAVFYAVVRLGTDERLVWAEPLLTPAAAGFMAALFYSFDSYFLPDLQRYSENGFVQPAWVYAVAATAVIVAVVTALVPRLGLRLSSLVLFLCLGTMTFIPGGH